MKVVSQCLLFASAAAVVSGVAIGHLEDPGAFDDRVDEEALNSDQLRRLHWHMDGDGDGRLSFVETLHYAKEVSKLIARDGVGAWLQIADDSNDGKLSLSEHVNFIRGQADIHDEADAEELERRVALEKAKFRAVDTNLNRILEADELLGLFFPETHDGVLTIVTQEAIRQKDKDGDGRLSPNEFWETDEGPGQERKLSQEEVDDFTVLDSDDDGFLSLDEARHWESGQFHAEDAMKRMFELADVDASMDITATELVRAREELSRSVARERLIEWAHHHDL